MHEEIRSKLIQGMRAIIQFGFFVLLSAIQ